MMPRRSFLLLATLCLTGCHHGKPSPAVSSSLTVPPLPGSTHPEYTITDIGEGMPSGINNRGQVVGLSPIGKAQPGKPPPYHGFLWSNGTRTEMPTLGGTYSNAESIDDAGRILGTASVPGRTRTGFPIDHLCLWDGRTLTDLEANPKFRGILAPHLIRSSGAMYAVSPPQCPDGTQHLWFYPNGIRPGPRFDRGRISPSFLRPKAINDKGTVIGQWAIKAKRHGNAAEQGFIWHLGDTHFTGLGTLGGQESEAVAVTNSDQVVGDSQPHGEMGAYQYSHAFLWKNGKMRDLGTLLHTDYSQSRAYAVSGSLIVGSSNAKGDPNSHPVLWSQDQIKDLSLLIPRGTNWIALVDAMHINNRGQIIGEGLVTGDNYIHTYLLTPLKNGKTL